MKKQIISTVLLISLSGVGQAQQPFTVKGKFSGLDKEAKVMLTYNNGESRVQDSAILKHGSFVITGKTIDASPATLELKSIKPDDGPMTMEKMLAMDVQDFYIEKGTITVNGVTNMKTAVIRGGEAQKDYLLLQLQLKPLQDKMSPLSEKMRQYMADKNESARTELFPQLRAIRMDMTKVEDDFVYSHPDSYVSFELVKRKGVVIDPKKFEPFFSSLSERIRNTKAGKNLTAKLELAKKIDIGRYAIEFTQNNTADVPVSLASLRGKYVLIDFWASWCGPCRAENPNVVKAYNKFKDKNFEIIGVSLDDKKAPWIQAIEKDGLPWVHVSDLQGWKNAVAVEYGVGAVPQNFLLDPNGVIIAKNLRGEELDKQLGELIKKQAF